MNRKITKFSKLIENYKAVMFDAYGVLKTHSGVIEGAAETINRLEIPFLVVTNDASKPEEEMSDWYQENSFNITTSNIVSSGKVTSNYISNQYDSNKIIAYLGRKGSELELSKLKIESQEIEEIAIEDYDKISHLVLFDASIDNVQQKIDLILNVVKDRDIEIVVANPDLAYQVSSSEIAIAVGSIAGVIENIIDRPLKRMGKPFNEIYSYAFEKLNSITPISKREILFVGDTLTTDIKGARDFGLDTALVLTGLTEESNLKKRIEDSGVEPTYICPSINS